MFLLVSYQNFDKNKAKTEQLAYAIDEMFHSFMPSTRDRVHRNEKFVEINPV